MGNQVNEEMTFRLCPVEKVDDKTGGLRIKVRIPPLDNNKDINQEPTKDNNFNGIPWCFPALPKMLHVNPKVGELVIVLLQKSNAPNSQRLFIGPVISQDYMMAYDYDFTGSNVRSSARRVLSGKDSSKTFDPFKNPAMDSANDGTIPNREDIAIRGRGNSDLILTDNEIRLRCGFKTSPFGNVKERLNFNDKDLGYLLMRYKPMQDSEGNSFSSSTTIVSDRINLISNDSKTFFDTGDRKDLITENVMKDIIDKAHKLPYGDILVDFLKSFVDIFLRHTHPFSMKKPALSPEDKDTLAPNWGDMLSQAVRIN